MARTPPRTVEDVVAENLTNYDSLVTTWTSNTLTDPIEAERKWKVFASATTPSASVHSTPQRKPAGTSIEKGIANRGCVAPQTTSPPPPVLPHSICEEVAATPSRIPTSDCNGFSVMMLPPPLGADPSDFKNFTASSSSQSPPANQQQSPDAPLPVIPQSEPVVLYAHINGELVPVNMTSRLRLVRDDGSAEKTPSPPLADAPLSSTATFNPFFLESLAATGQVVGNQPMTLSHPPILSAPNVNAKPFVLHALTPHDHTATYLVAPTTCAAVNAPSSASNPSSFSLRPTTMIHASSPLQHASPSIHRISNNVPSSTTTSTASTPMANVGGMQILPTAYAIIRQQQLMIEQLQNQVATLTRQVQAPFCAVPVVLPAATYVHTPSFKIHHAFSTANPPASATQMPSSVPPREESNKVDDEAHEKRMWELFGHKPTPIVSLNTSENNNEGSTTADVSPGHQTHINSFNYAAKTTSPSTATLQASSRQEMLLAQLSTAPLLARPPNNNNRTLSSAPSTPFSNTMGSTPTHYGTTETVSAMGMQVVDDSAAVYSRYASNDLPSPALAQAPGYCRKPCRAFQQGRCKHGDKCLFSHSIPTPSSLGNQLVANVI